AARRAPRGAAPAGGAPRGPGALEVHRADAAQSPVLQDRADARFPGLPLHLQLLHRLGRAVSAAGHAGVAGGSQVPAPKAAPAAFPGPSLLSAFAPAAPLHLESQRTDRVLPFPFHFRANNHAMNVKPKNYAWRDFYDHVIRLTRYTYAGRAIVRRFRATHAAI